MSKQRIVRPILVPSSGCNGVLKAWFRISNATGSVTSVTGKTVHQLVSKLMSGGPLTSLTAPPQMHWQEWPEFDGQCFDRLECWCVSTPNGAWQQRQQTGAAPPLPVFEIAALSEQQSGQAKMAATISRDNERRGIDQNPTFKRTAQSYCRQANPAISPFLG